jgi:hypothetical protein
MRHVALFDGIEGQEYAKYVKVYKHTCYIGQCRYIFSDAAWRFIPADTSKPAGPKGMTWTAALEYLREPVNGTQDLT